MCLLKEYSKYHENHFDLINFLCAFLERGLGSNYEAVALGPSERWAGYGYVACRKTRWFLVVRSERKINSSVHTRKFMSRGFILVPMQRSLNCVLFVTPEVV